MTTRIETELWPVVDLIPYAKNAKKHSDAQVKLLADLISKQGWTQPIVVVGDEEGGGRGVVVVGHGRRLAAIRLGLINVPVRVLYGYSKQAIDAMRLSDNRATSTDYDIGVLQEELGLLAEDGLDLLDLGFSEKEISFLTDDLGVLDDSAFAEDIIEAVEKQTEDNKEAAFSTDAQETPITEVLGFKRVTIGQARAIRGFIARIEGKSGKKGVEALLAHIETEAA